MLSDRFKNDKESLLFLNEMQLNIKRHIDYKVEKNEYRFESYYCSICNGDSFEAVSEKDRYGLYMPVKLCKKCGLLQTNPRMSESSYEMFYKYQQKKLYTGKVGPDEGYFNKQYKRGQFIFDYLEKNLSIKIEGLNIFEIGCSCGGILLYFKEKGNNILGIDLNKPYLNYGLLKGLDLRLSDFKYFDLPWIPDIIIYSHTLEHIIDPIPDLFRLSQLNSNVKLYIEVPGIKNLKNSYNKDLLEYLQNAHIYHFTLTSLKNMLSKAGWALLNGDEYIRSIFTPSNISFESDYEEVYNFLKDLESKLPSPQGAGL